MPLCRKNHRKSKITKRCQIGLLELQFQGSIATFSASSTNWTKQESAGKPQQQLATKRYSEKAKRHFHPARPGFRIFRAQTSSSRLISKIAVINHRKGSPITVHQNGHGLKRDISSMAWARCFFVTFIVSSNKSEVTQAMHFKLSAGRDAGPQMSCATNPLSILRNMSIYISDLVHQSVEVPMPQKDYHYHSSCEAPLSKINISEVGLSSHGFDSKWHSAFWTSRKRCSRTPVLGKVMQPYMSSCQLEATWRSTWAMPQTLSLFQNIQTIHITSHSPVSRGSHGEYLHPMSYATRGLYIIIILLVKYPYLKSTFRGRALTWIRRGIRHSAWLGVVDLRSRTSKNRWQWSTWKSVWLLLQGRFGNLPKSRVQAESRLGGDGSHPRAVPGRTCSSGNITLSHLADSK